MKKYSSLFWIFFIVSSAIFLAAWFVFWEVKNQGLRSLDALFDTLPAAEESKTDFGTITALADAVLRTDGKEKVFLILFQNNLELRPGGGFIGSFGIIKVRDGSVTEFALHDTGNFDGRIPDSIEPPYPMRETLRIGSWKLRDSNYSPHFAENVKWAEKFYQMGQGAERFDGVIAITANVLTSVLEVVGPIEIEGFPGTYTAENAVVDLEYQVEQGYRNQNIDFGERKSVMGVLGIEILERVKDLSLGKKLELFRVLLSDLEQKDIQLSFKDETLNGMVSSSGWDGAMNGDWKADYLYPVDANLNAFKTDYYIRRSYEYVVDFTEDVPKASLSVRYANTAEKKDWFAKDYQTYFRAFVPKGSFLTNVDGAKTAPVYGEFMNKKYFGVLIQVPIRSEKVVKFEYTLPKEITESAYNLMLQKQAGVNDIPVKLTFISKDGTRQEKDLTVNRDLTLDEVE